jgi:hypothetical protein
MRTVNVTSIVLCEQAACEGSHNLRTSRLRPQNRKVVFRQNRSTTIGSIVNCLAIGDSALSCDPLSGRGVWAALKEADQSTPLVMQLLAGDCSGLAAYNLRHLARFNNYQMARHSYYNLEHRWSESSFWRKRQKSFQFVHPSTDDSYFLS